MINIIGGGWMGSLKSIQCKDFKSVGNYLTIPKVKLGSGNESSYTSPKGRTDRTYYNSCLIRLPM